MIAKETKDMDEIKSILLDPEIKERVECDEMEMSDPPADAKYVGCYVDDKIVGIGMYHEVGGVTVCHMNLLKDYRKTHGLEFGREALKFSPSKTLYTNIPETFPGIMKYVEALGFSLVDVVKKAITKNGQPLDVFIYKNSEVM